MDLSILINWMSPFPILGVSGVLFHFYFEKIFLLANNEETDRCHVLGRLIWECTVCLCPKNGLLGLYGLRKISTELFFGETFVFQICSL